MWLACKFSVIYLLVATVWDVDGVSIAREALPTSSPGIQISEAQRNQPRVVPPNTVLNPSESNHIPDSKGPMIPPQPPFGTNQMPQQQFMMPPQNRPPPEMMMMMMSSPPPPMMTTTRQQQNKTLQGNVTTMMPSILNSTRANNNTRREADHNSTTTTSSPMTTSAHGGENLMKQVVPPQQALGAPPPGMVPFNPMASFSSPMMMNQQPVFVDQMGRVMMLVPHQAFFDPIRNAFVVRDNNMPQQMQGPQGPPVPQMMMQAPMQLFPMPMGQQPMQPMFIPGQMGPQQQVPFGFNPNMPQQQQQQQPFPSRTEDQKPQLNATVTKH